jgi:hypothetical protein
MKLTKQNQIKEINEMKNFLKDTIKSLSDPYLLIKQIDKKKINDKSYKKDLNKLTKIQDLMKAFGTETGFSLIEAIHPDYKSLALQLKNELEQEYNCQTISEKMLIDEMIISHINKLYFSSLLWQNGACNYPSREESSYLSVISKQINYSSRQFISALETLKAIKQPEIKVNFKTKNAFISNNQQINDNRNQNKISEN